MKVGEHVDVVELEAVRRDAVGKRRLRGSGARAFADDGGLRLAAVELGERARDGPAVGLAAGYRHAEVVEQQAL